MTLYLLLTYMKQIGLKEAEPKYEIRYETREDSADYLRQPDKEKNTQNIDYIHIYQRGNVSAPGSISWMRASVNSMPTNCTVPFSSTSK